MLATPTTLITLLRTVAHGWTQEALASNARQVHALGRELYDRLATVSNHLERLGRSLTAAVRAYNAAIGSVETRVLVSARRMRDLEVTDDDLCTPSPVEEAVRPTTAAELLVTDHVPALGAAGRNTGAPVPTAGSVLAQHTDERGWRDDPAVGE
jgi:DNA recombination protein RmuC